MANNTPHKCLGADCKGHTWGTLTGNERAAVVRWFNRPGAISERELIHHRYFFKVDGDIDYATGL